MAMRPDGVLFIFGVEIEAGIAPNLLEHLFPTFIPLDGGRGLPEHDGFRLVRPVADVASLDPDGVRALALMPGAPVVRDWGYVTRPGVPWVAPAIDAGTPEEPGNSPIPTKPGCGCSSSVKGSLWVLALMLTRLRLTPRRPTPAARSRA